MTPSRVLFVALALAATLVASPALAHKPSDSYLTLTVAGAAIDGRWDVALRDLDNALSLDRDGNGAITWGELTDRESEVTAFVLGHLALLADGAACRAAPGGLRVAAHSDGTYAVLDFRAACGAEPRQLAVDYSLFFDIDPQHRGIVRIDDGAGTRTAIFSPNDAKQTFERAELRPLHQLGAAVRLGVDHIFAGIDHLCFLVALLLPAVFVRIGRTAWVPVPRLGPALAEVLKIVTAFTLAHSITLTLATLEIIRLPSRLVESGIAASVIVAAINNVYPLLGDERWAAAFALGLLHGFGFSAALMDLGLPRLNLALTLFGFNVGVEIGQMALVAVVVPLTYMARRAALYRRVGLVGGSLVIASVASVWFVERAFAVKIL
ncbi:MAG: HupE/UreJ family protein [Polyangiaceae bacterium]|nr:HupE/UreJ family protein [Polyangiaceae bacterium]